MGYLPNKPHCAREPTRQGRDCFEMSHGHKCCWESHSQHVCTKHISYAWCMIAAFEHSGTVQDDTDLLFVILYNHCCTAAVIVCEDSPIHLKQRSQCGCILVFKAHEIYNLSRQHLKQENDVTCPDCSSFAANALKISDDRHVTCTSACGC